jgi:hypothetical protein
MESGLSLPRFGDSVAEPIPREYPFTFLISAALRPALRRCYFLFVKSMTLESLLESLMIFTAKTRFRTRS